MAFTEFCCRSGGSNLNAGTRTGNSTEPGTAADFTYASGNWVASTGVFTVASGNPSSDGVAVGDFASVYADGSTVTGFVGRVTARDTTTITVSLTAKAGTAPTDGTGNRTLKIGGAWKGPNGTDKFPFGTIASTLTNASSDPPRVNFKNDATYSITAALGPGTSGIWYEGYSTSYGDDVRATIDGGTSGASYYLLDMTSGTSCTLKNLIFQNNGATGSNGLVGIYAGTNAIRCVFNNTRGEGLYLGSASAEAIECEAFSCCKSNNTGGAFYASAASALIRCIASSNTGSNISGIYSNGTSPVMLLNCITTGNTVGIHINGGSNGGTTAIGCDVYNNSSDGIKVSNAAQNTVVIESSNFVKNGGYGINCSGGIRRGRIINCGFGSGTQVNASGNTNALSNAIEIGSVSYASNVTPWVDPANGDFRVNLATAKNAGYGYFTQIASGQSGTVGYPDIGAAQAAASGGGSRLVNIRGGADQ